MLAHTYRRFAKAGIALGATATLTYDHYNGQVIPRTGRTFWGALLTLIDYKYLMDDTTIEGADDMHSKVAARWHDIVCQNEGLYVKLGQQVTTMGHVLPAVYMKTFSKLQDKAPQISRDEVDRVFAGEFGGQTPGQVFKTFDYVPVASASIAQVHKAELMDGTVVAVKVQKPMIELQVAADLWSYRMCVWALEYAFDLPMYWTTHDVCDAINEELDFTHEMENSQHAKKMFEDAGVTNVHVPTVYTDLTSRKIMTMEWVDGVKCTDRGTIEGKWGFKCAETTGIIVDAFSQSIFLHGFVHGDPHPGNIFVRPHPADASRPQVVILDHGMYVTFTEAFRLEYCELWKAMVLMDMPALQRLCDNWGIGDATFFASSQMFKPYSATMNSATQKPTKDDIIKMRIDAKARVRTLLTDTNKIPRELIILGRHLNIVRAINKDMGSPVNRAKVLAQYASIGLEAPTPPTRYGRDNTQAGPSAPTTAGGQHEASGVDAVAVATVARGGARQGPGGVGLVATAKARVRTGWNRFSFWFRMLVLDMAYLGTQLYRQFNILVGRKSLGFEDVIDRQMETEMRKLGLELNIDDGLG